MRNLAQYPITKDEMLSLLQRVMDDVMLNAESELSVGDMTPSILQEAIRIINESEEIE